MFKLNNRVIESNKIIKGALLIKPLLSKFKSIINIDDFY